MPTDVNSDRAVTGGVVAPLAGGTLPAGSKLLLGFENSYVRKWDKYLTIRIKHSGSQGLSVGTSYAAGGNFDGSSCEVLEEYYEQNGDYKLLIKISPQPDWEWVAIQNTSGSAVTFDKVTIGAECRKIPSLTGWGIGALVILLAGTAAWLARRRKPVLSA